MGYRQPSRSGIDTSLLVVASIIVVADCSLIRQAAARFALPAHEASPYGASALAPDNENQISIRPTPNSNTWWRRNGGFTNIEDRYPPGVRSDEQGSLDDEYRTVVRRNTGASVSRRFGGTCGLAPRNPIVNDRIFNGQTQKYGEWPSYVMVLVIIAYPRIGKSCGGTLVSDRHVLTAAHCVYEDANGVNRRVEPSAVSIFHAVHSMKEKSGNQQKSVAKSICVAKEYVNTDKPEPHDWALIELKEPIAFNDYIQPACLPEEHVQTKGENSECWVVGTGLMRTHPYQVEADYVQKLPVEQTPCDKIGIFDEFRACYANYDEPVGNICPGDSGGPVLCLDNQDRWTVVALASGGINCTDAAPFNILAHYGAIYTDMKVLLNDVKAQCRI